MQVTRRFTATVIKYRYIYLLLLPGMTFYLIFSYLPMYGVTLAFKDYQISRGILRSPWIGVANFREVFRLDDFWRAFRNTVVISFQRILVEFPVPILLSLLLNEVRVRALKRFYQTIFTFPHFLSWIVVSGIVFSILSDNGVLNRLLVSLGAPKQGIMMNARVFRPLLYVSSIWKSAGWSSIIYLAAIASINPELYEACTIDGAGRLRQLLHITWPGIRSTAAVLLILSIGNVMNAGFDQIFNMYNASVYDTVDIIDTYIYRRTFQLGSDFGTSTAVGLFKSVINLTLLFGANFAVRRMGEPGVV